jgi:hypothetical protein
VRLAALPARALVLDTDGVHQAAVVVGDDQVDAGEATAPDPA